MLELDAKPNTQSDVALQVCRTGVQKPIAVVASGTLPELEANATTVCSGCFADETECAFQAKPGKHGRIEEPYLNANATTPP